MVCDSGNNRIQVFKLNGFNLMESVVGKFGAGGSKLGEVDFPVSLAVFSNGRIVVSEWKNNRMQILK